jgi:MFS family permease
MFTIFIIVLFVIGFEGSLIINANDMLHERVGFSNVEAGKIAMTPLVLNIIMSPLWAYIK